MGRFTRLELPISVKRCMIFWAVWSGGGMSDEVSDGDEGDVNAG